MLNQSDDRPEAVDRGAKWPRRRWLGAAALALLLPGCGGEGEGSVQVSDGSGEMTPARKAKMSNPGLDAGPKGRGKSRRGGL